MAAVNFGMVATVVVHDGITATPFQAFGDSLRGNVLLAATRSKRRLLRDLVFFELGNPVLATLTP